MAIWIPLGIAAAGYWGIKKVGPDALDDAVDNALEGVADTTQAMISRGVPMIFDVVGASLVTAVESFYGAVKGAINGKEVQVISTLTVIALSFGTFLFIRGKFKGSTVVITPS